MAGLSSDDRITLASGPEAARAGLTPATLAALLSIEPTRVLRRMPGRVTFVVELDGAGAIVVKRTVAGRPAWHRWPWAGPAAKSPSEREYDALVGLGRLDLPVPTPLGWASGQAGDARIAVVAMALVPHAENLRQRLRRVPAEGVERAVALAALIARLHAAGWYHRDLYLDHVAVEEGTGRLVLLDLARARGERAPRRRWFVKDLGALDSSAEVDEDLRCRFFEAYCDARGLAPRARASWARAIRARSARIARHVPRHADPDTPEGVL